MSRRNQPLEPDRPKQSYPERLREDRETQIRCALTWLGVVPKKAKEGGLDQARSAVAAACETIVKLNVFDRYWLVDRCLADLAEAGVPIDERWHKHWLAKLRAHVEKEPAPMLGEAIGVGATRSMDWNDPA